MPSAPDGSRPGTFYVNLTDPQKRMKYQAEAIGFHESIPGHHLQLAIAGELEHIPTFQRYMGATSFMEGWGLYTERLADEIPIVLVSHDVGVISRTVRTIACLNVRMHYHHSKELSPEMVEAVYGCPVDLVAHGVPHRVLELHDGHQ